MNRNRLGIGLFFKKKITKSESFRFKVLSVGNLSVGGTGKSVFVQFLIKKLNKFNCAVVLRGYRGQNEKRKKSFIVSDGKSIFCDTTICGDEAFLASSLLDVPVVVGRNRATSCKLLEQNFPGLDFVVLDDAYQNFHVKKDFEVLLLDARRPMENGHCLPAGRLREKDFSRADAIILTHADYISAHDIQEVKRSVLCRFDKNKIFSAAHRPTDLLLLGYEKVDSKFLRNKKFLVFAGIGSFQYFIESVKNIGVNVCSSKEYSDHHEYDKDDARILVEIIKKDCLDGAITTQKDWVKLLPLLKRFDNWQDLPFYVLGVEFEFLSVKEKRSFFKLLANTIL